MYGPSTGVKYAEAGNGTNADDSTKAGGDVKAGNGAETRDCTKAKDDNKAVNRTKAGIGIENDDSFKTAVAGHGLKADNGFKAGDGT